MPITERISQRSLRAVGRRIEDGVEYVDLEPVRRRDRVFDQIVGRMLGYTGVGVAFSVGAILEKLEARNQRNRRESHISPF